MSMANYRPILLLTIFSKLFMKAMHSKLSHHLHTNNILVTELCGFRKGISNENPAFRPTDSVLIKKCWRNFLSFGNISYKDRHI